MEEKDCLFEALLKFVVENETREEEYAGRMERWCMCCGAYLNPKEGIKHEPDCLYAWASGFWNARNEDDNLMKTQKFHERIPVTEERMEDAKAVAIADEADQMLEQEALSHGFG